ncbi:MAG TPA: DUF2334 domain-containing protein [Candidatus Corynebacterium gallistercoris]|uniref:DUF2334 domain-containing protein n=1 Tax=Candidatus Corynebacterium gallistercoris TaxID=2838530 RepID=A0A9D1RX81_9CORY|nr:DUF2334 domain-containing protein [Candidatus Corynebacterium gallistercoris]
MTTYPALMLTLTGIESSTLQATRKVRDHADKMGIKAGLVVSLNGGQWKLSHDAETQEFLRESAAAGHEMLLGGLGPLSAKPATSGGGGGAPGKGEFHRLGKHESTLRLSAARRQLDSLGLHPRVFAPSRWLASEAALQAAKDVGFAVAADAYSVRNLETGTRHDVRVLAFGDGFGAVTWWRRNVRNTTRRMAGKNQDIRLSLSGGKASHKEIRNDMEQILERLLRHGYQPQTYRGYANK